mgnify:CR=1 FL=1
MVEFLRVQYRLGRVTGEQLNKLITDGKITEEDKNYIMS